MSEQEHRVKALFNGMAEEYDQLEDEWYPHFFQAVEKALQGHLPSGAGKKALDVGCGTGLQSVLLASRGFETTGIDISAALLGKAREKARALGLEIDFLEGSATALPFPDAAFDVAASCGSVLGFVPDYPRALAEIARVVKPAGLVVLEVDQRWNLDLLWGLVDIAVGGRLGFEQSWKEAWKNLSSPPSRGITQDYPFTKLDGSVETMTVRLFTLPEIFSECEKAGLELVRLYGVHVVTNLLPSTWLAHPKLSKPLRRFARALAALDDKVAGIAPFNRFGNNAILIFRKR